MDIQLLRTLTGKSKLGFGKYYDSTIQELITLKHTGYLRWVYYSISGITFTDEILHTIGIHEDEYRIKKPGVNPELLLEINKLLILKTPFLIREHNRRVFKIRRSVKKCNINRTVERISKKSVLQAVNHNKF